MTREEAKAVIEDIIIDVRRTTAEEDKALRMAIEALSINVNQLNFGTPITTTESFADVSPMEWSEDVLSGEKKVEVKADMVIEKLSERYMGCHGCRHYDSLQTSVICYDCSRAYKDRYEE